MIVSISQPAYMPWLGYLDRIAASDLHVVLDHVQFEKNSYTNRNRVQTAAGTTWLTIPVKTAGSFGQLPIHGLRWADEGRWRQKHMTTLRSSYGQAPRFAEHLEFLEAYYSSQRSSDRLLPVVMELAQYLLRTFDVSTPLIRSSELELENTKSELILEICQRVGATTYLSGPLGRDYLDLKRFASHGLTVEFHDYEPQPYRQMWRQFESHLAAIDLIMCHKFPEADEIMRAGRRVVSAH